MEVTFVVLCPRCRCQTCSDSQLQIDDNHAYWRGQNLHLTTTEMRILRRLVADAGRYITYRGIYDVVHYPGFVAGTGVEGFKSNVRSMIKRMRHKFRAVDPTFCSIRVATNIGYSWHEEFIPIIEEIPKQADGLAPQPVAALT
jgi:DNA-binding response OmpR family regulator